MIICFLCISAYSLAQTCCTGGVPHLAGLRIPQTGEKEVGVSLSYIYNRNGDLIFNNSSIESSTNYRVVNSVLNQWDYGISKKISVSFILPYIFQNEVINFNDNSQRYDNKGVGDVSIWGSYKVDLSDKLFFTASLGLKFPTGATDRRDEISHIPLPFSFQSGTGSYDFGYFSFFKYSFDAQKLYNVVGQVAVKINTRGNKFEAHPNYLFGHSAQLSLLFNRPFVISSSILDINIGTNYQYRTKDQFDGGFYNENTGGQWVNAVAGFSLALNPKLLVSLNGFVPVYRSINGLQLSTTWMGNLGMNYVFN